MKTKIRYAAIESLEHRQLFSAAPVFGSDPTVNLNGNELVIVGTTQNDTISVTYEPLEGPITPNSQPSHWTVVVNGNSQTFGDVIASVQIFGGPGNDSIAYVGKDQVMTSADMSPAIALPSGAALICGGQGKDTITLDASSGDTLRGGDGADLITSTGDADSILGGRDNDTLLGQGGGTVLGQGGNDSLGGYAGGIFGSLVSVVKGGAGNDTLVGGDIVIFSGVAGGPQETFYGSTHTYLYGNAGDDSLVGGEGGNNLLGGGPGHDTIVGATGTHDVDTIRSVGGGDELFPGPLDVLIG